MYVQPGACFSAPWRKGSAENVQNRISVIKIPNMHLCFTPRVSPLARATLIAALHSRSLRFVSGDSPRTVDERLHITPQGGGPSTWS